MKPSFLSKDNNNKIYIVAPSMGAYDYKKKKRLEKSINNLTNLGYEITVGKNVYKNEGIAASASKEDRANEIMDAFKSDASLVISTAGGEVMSQILKLIDFNVIKNNPKWFMGYSDNTNLIYTITTILDIETIYGPHATSFYMTPFTYDTQDAYLMLTGKTTFKAYKRWESEYNNKLYPIYNLNKKTKMINYNFTKVKGRIIGGCLDCLSTLCGTKFDNTVNYINKHKDEGIIFFLEAYDYNSVGIIRVIEQLKSAGWFNNVSAFIIGRSVKHNDKSFGISITDAYYESLKDLNVPIILNASIGHLGPSLPIRCGALCEVEFKNNNLYFNYDTNE